MNDELTECYELLGLSPGASSEELKVAYRDLAKVWHPDRFLHDPRLQAKAQEKLKEINEAYDLLRSGKAKRKAEPSPATDEWRRPPPPEHFNQYAQAHAHTRNGAVRQKVRWRLILGPVLILAAVFFATYGSLLRPSGKSQVRAIEQAEAPSNPEQQQAARRDNTVADELPARPDRANGKSQSEESVGGSTTQASAAPVRPMPSVMVVIDPYTGMIARPDCPLKSRMTYPSGSEPHQLCNAVHPSKKVEDSRIKSVAKRLASPGKWFGEGAKPEAASKPDPKSP